MTPCSGSAAAAGSRSTTAAFCSARWQIISPRHSAPKVRRFRFPPHARPAPAPSSSASRPFVAAKPTLRFASQPTARSIRKPWSGSRCCRRCRPITIRPQAAVAALFEEPRRFRHGRRRRRARAGKLEAATARGAQDPRHPRRLRRTGGFFPPHPLQPRRQADHRMRAQCPVRRRHGLRPDRLHQRPRHRHAGKRQDGVSRHLHGVRRARHARFRCHPTNRWSDTPSPPPAPSKRCSRC